MESEATSTIMSGLTKRHWWVVVCALMASCSAMPKDFEGPRVNITDLTPKEMTVFEQRFDVKLRIQNPNDLDLSITGLRFDIELNEREFANGMSGERVTVPRFGSQVVDVEVFTTLASFLRQVQDLNAGPGQKVRYRLKGTVFAESPGTFKAPFDEKGEIELNFGSHAEK
jgi:LEA14-like dessication related protein